MRYDDLRKLERNNLLYDTRVAHPELSDREVGDMFNVSRQRAREIYLNEKKRREILERASKVSIGGR